MAKAKKIPGGASAGEARPASIETAEQRAAAYRQCFTSGAGSVVLDDLQKWCGRRSSYHENPYRMAFYEGQRDVLLQILALIDLTPNEKES